MNASLQHHALATTRIHDPRLGQKNIRVQPGEFYVSDDAHVTIITVLGSCVAACVRNPFNGFGGLNHFMLPESHDGEWGGASSRMRYGNHAMETLINSVLKTGCHRRDLEVKLFGGANMYVGSSVVGTKNSEFALDYVREEGLNVVAQDLGGIHGRRIHYSPVTGRVRRLLLTEGQDSSVTRNERQYSSTLHVTRVEGDIELFQ